MKHLVLLMLLSIGGYFLWYYLNNKEKVWAKILLKRHTVAVLFLAAIVLFFLAIQVTVHSTKIL